MTYTVTRAPSGDCPPEVFSLWEGGLGIQGDLASRHRWAYGTNPAGPSETFLLEWCGEPESRDIVGSFGVLPRRFRCGGRILEAALCVDFVVESKHRTVLPAVTLQRVAGEFVQERYAFGYGIPNRRAEAVKRRSGYREVARMATYVRVLRHAAALEAYVPRLGPLARAGAVLDAASFVAAKVRGLGRPRYKFVWQDEPDARFDDLYATAAGRHVLLGDRTAAQLAWRFRQKPGLLSTFATISDADGRLLAYGAVERKGRAASLKDFLASGDVPLAALLDLVARHLASDGFERLAVRFLGASRIGAILRAQGFIDVARAARWASTAGIALQADERPLMLLAGRSCPVPADVLSDPESWYLTDGDEDW